MLQKLKDIITRSVGVILFAFIPGMASGAATGIGPVLGGLNGVATVFSSIIIYFGIQLAWDASVSHEDIEKGFRAAVAKQAEGDKDVKAALELTEGATETPAAPAVEAKDFTLTTPAAPATPVVEAPATGLAPDPFG
jgi:hypothetical protein